MVVEENLYVIVKAGILWCSLIYYECRVRGSPHKKGSENRRSGDRRRGERESGGY